MDPDTNKRKSRKKVETDFSTGDSEDQAVSADLAGASSREYFPASASLSKAELSEYRLCPTDGLLEYCYRAKSGTMVRWVPYVPSAKCIFAPEDVSWRKWLFNYCHEGLLNAHRPQAQTYHLLKRMSYWPSQARDVDRWCASCMTCMKFRSTRLSTGPLKSMIGDESNVGKLPWQDVIIDCMGPFTRAEGGEQYILSYTCTQLKVSKLESMKSLQAGYFSRALVRVPLRTGIMPDIVRSDRGPEMTSKINEEFLAICNVRHQLGAALTPRHQGLGERSHQVVTANTLVLMHAVCEAHPQEWPALLPVVEYVQTVSYTHLRAHET